MKKRRERGRELKVGGSICGKKKGEGTFFLSFPFRLFSKSLFFLLKNSHAASVDTTTLSVVYYPGLLQLFPPHRLARFAEASCVFKACALELRECFSFLVYFPSAGPQHTGKRVGLQERQNRTEGQKGAEREMQMGEGRKAWYFRALEDLQ